VAPVAARPGALARTLALGELVCTALEEVFGGPPADAAPRDPLLLHLFENEEDYLRFSGGLEWSAGHFDRLRELSRVYVPSGDDDFERVLATYAHELTHHWLQMRCPRYPFRPVEAEDAARPGYWIVEGFASMVEEFQFDWRGGSWSDAVRRSDRLDLVANAGAEGLVAWPEVFGWSQVDFQSRAPANRGLAPSSWWLGRGRPYDFRSAYYAQAAAACHYYWKRDRERLLGYLAKYYAGADEGLDVAAHFGVPADELGRLVTDFARAETLGAAR
jgi:hypothetical protein